MMQTGEEHLRPRWSSSPTCKVKLITDQNVYKPAIRLN